MNQTLKEEGRPQPPRQHPVQRFALFFAGVSCLIWLVLLVEYRTARDVREAIEQQREICRKNAVRDWRANAEALNIARARCRPGEVGRPTISPRGWTVMDKQQQEEQEQ